MPRTWLISDTHFGHANIYRFLDGHGNRVRPIADNATDGDEIMIERWNAVVHPSDRIYHLGDVAIPRTGLAVLHRLNGRKVLIRGNHDIFKLQDYSAHFDDIRGTHKLDKFILSHYPIHHESIPMWTIANIHGHIHEKHMADPRYINMSVEVIDYRPVDFEQIREENKDGYLAH